MGELKVPSVLPYLYGTVDSILYEVSNSLNPSVRPALFFNTLH